MNPESVAPPHDASKAVWIKDVDKELDLLAFTGMLSILVNGGIGFGQTFDLLNSYHRGWLQPVLRDLETTVINDREPLSKAMAKHPDVFSEPYVATVELGESADLGAVLENLYRQILRDLRSDSFKQCPFPAALGNSCRQISEILEIVGSESRAISLVAKTSPHEQVQEALLELEKQSLEGIKLADCQLPSLFPPLFAGLLAAHDVVGSVPSAFRNLADLLESRSGPLVIGKSNQGRSGKTPVVGFAEGQLLNGRYRIESPLGRGGMGAVYLGFDTQTNTQVALKSFVPGSDAPSADFQRRFQDEVKILKSLHFPGIPEFSDSFEVEGQSFLVMEYIQGLSLIELLEKTRGDAGKEGLPAQLVVRVGIQVCKILEHIHGLEKPLIHRDIKPHNIIIRDSDERIFLVDFGLAREVTGKNSSLVSVVGTAAYAPLEQFQGRPEARSDLYSLAVTLCELLSGQPPIPLQAEPIHKLVPTVHEDLARILNRATRTLVQERYANAQDMLLLLEDVLPRLTQPVQPLPQESSEDKLEQMIRRWGRGKSSTTLLAPPVVEKIVIPEPPPRRDEILGDLLPIPEPRKFPVKWVGILVVAILGVGCVMAWRASKNTGVPPQTKKTRSATPSKNR